MLWNKLDCVCLFTIKYIFLLVVLGRLLLSQMGFSYQWEKKSFIHLTSIQAMAVQERAAKHTASELSPALEMVNIRPLDHQNESLLFWGIFFPYRIVIMHHPTVSS